MEKEINVTKVLSTFDEAINKLEADFKPELLSNSEVIRIDKELTEVIRLGLKVKLQYQQRRIANLIKDLDENQDLDLIKIKLMTNELDKALDMNKAA